MSRILFVLFIVVPIVEIAMLIQVSEVIGGWTTVLLIIITAYVGAKMVKQQGLQTIAKIQQKSAQGQIPGEELFSGVCILISGVLLVTPGIATDVIGFLLLTPAVRKKMAQQLKSRINLFGGGQGQASMFTFTQNGHDFSQQSHDFHEQSGDFSQPSHDFQEHDAPKDPFAQPQDFEQNHIEKPNSVIDGEFTRKE